MIRFAARRISPRTRGWLLSWRAATVIVVLTGSLLGSTEAAVSKGDAAPACAAAALDAGVPISLAEYRGKVV
jgi:hypothetical protein